SVQRHAENLHRAVQRPVVAHRRTRRTHARNHVLVRRFELDAEVSGVPEFRAREHRLEHRASLAVGREVTLRHPAHQRLGGIGGDEVLRQLEAQMLRRRGTAGQDVQRMLALRHSAAFDFVAQEILARKIVALGVEVKSARIYRRRARTSEVPPAPHEWKNFPHPGALHARPSIPAAAAPGKPPPGQNMGKRDYVSLRVSAVHAQRMQFHQLARVVLVYSLELALRAGAAGRSVLPVVQVEEHRRMMRRRAEDRAELAQRMRPNRSLLERPGPDTIQPFAGENIEVVEPERGHYFLQLPRPFDCTHHPRLDHLAHHDPLLDSQVFGRVLDRPLVLALCFGVPARRHDGPLVFDEQRDRRHMQGAIFDDALGQIARNRYRLRMQLLLHVAFGPNCADPLEITGPRPEREPVHYYDVTRAIPVYLFEGRFEYSGETFPHHLDARPHASIRRSNALRNSGSFNSGSSIDFRVPRGTGRSCGRSRRLSRPCTNRSSRTTSSPSRSVTRARICDFIRFSSCIHIAPETFTTAVWNFSDTISVRRAIASPTISGHAFASRTIAK